MDELIKLLTKDLTKTALFIVGLLCHLAFGCLYIYFFNKQLFLELDIFKLLLIILACTFPIFIILTFILMGIYSVIDKDNTKIGSKKITEFIVLSLYSMCWIFGLIIIFRIFTNDFTFKDSLYWIFILGFIILCSYSFIEHKYMKKEKENKVIENKK